MSPELILSLILVLLILSSIFSGSETAFIGASRARMKTLEEEGNMRAKLVNRLVAQQERLLGAILIGNNLVNIFASALATYLLSQFFGTTGVLYATLLMTVLVVVFSEVLPKTLAIRRAEAVALFFAPLLRFVLIILTPLSLAVQGIVNILLFLLGVRNRNKDEEIERSEQELKGAIDLHAEHTEEDEARHMLRSILELEEVEVNEIMTHRKQVEMIDADLRPDQILSQVLSSRYTRFPIWREDRDNIVGVLHTKDLLRIVHRDSNVDQINIPLIAQRPWFIPDTTSLISQLRGFRTRHEHFALVVDEYGGFEGIVTLEDILEEIVGDIADEHDIVVPGIHKQSDESYIVDGTVTIRDFNRRLNWKLPDEEASTLAGLVIYAARYIPDVGQSFLFHGCRFKILEKKRNQLSSLQIWKDETPLSSE